MTREKARHRAVMWAQENAYNWALDAKIFTIKGVHVAELLGRGGKEFPGAPRLVVDDGGRVTRYRPRLPVLAAAALYKLK